MRDLEKCVIEITPKGVDGVKVDFKLTPELTDEEMSSDEFRNNPIAKTVHLFIESMEARGATTDGVSEEAPTP